jgi:hypothetical protein
MEREVADEVKPFLDVPVFKYVRSLMANAAPIDPREKSGNTPVDMITHLIEPYATIHLPSKAEMNAVLDHADTPTTFKIGVPGFTQAQKDFVRSSEWFKNRPRKLRPTNKYATSMLVALMEWGGAEIITSLTNDEFFITRANTLFRDNRFELFHSDWLMDSPIAAAEFVYLFGAFWEQANDAIDFTVRDVMPYMSDQTMRGIIAERSWDWKPRDKKMSDYNYQFASVWESVKRVIHTDQTGWYFLAQLPLTNVRGDEHTPLVEDVMAYRTLAQKYTPQDVAPWVVKGYKATMIPEAMENDIDLGLFQSMLSGV